jgi:hypothetical protein
MGAVGKVASRTVAVKVGSLGWAKATIGSATSLSSRLHSRSTSGATFFACSAALSARRRAVSVWSI